MLCRKPLQDVILGLRAMLEGGLCFEGVLPVLQELPEPPQIDNIEKSFTVLHSGMFVGFHVMAFSNVFLVLHIISWYDDSSNGSRATHCIGAICRSIGIGFAIVPTNRFWHCIGHSS